MHPSTPLTEAQMHSRINLALSLINWRRPSLRVLELVHLALLGATVGDLMELERGRH